MYSVLLALFHCAVVFSSPDYSSIPHINCCRRTQEYRYSTYFNLSIHSSQNLEKSKYFRKIYYFGALFYFNSSLFVKFFISVISLLSLRFCEYIITSSFALATAKKADIKYITLMKIAGGIVDRSSVQTMAKTAKALNVLI